MPRVTVVPEDSTVIVDGVAVTIPLPSCDPNWHALQYYPDLDRLVIECKSASVDPLSGQAASNVIAPFVEAHRAELDRMLAESAAQPGQPEGTDAV